MELSELTAAAFSSRRGATLDQSRHVLSDGPGVCTPRSMHAVLRWAAFSTLLSTLLVTSSAGAEANSLLALCPAEESAARHPPTCSAVYLLSRRGYAVLPGTRIHIGVATRRLNLMIRIAVF